jgi:hypothetical protein
MIITYIDTDGEIKTDISITEIAPVVNGAKLFVNKTADVNFPKIIPMVNLIRITQDTI